MIIFTLQINYYSGTHIVADFVKFKFGDGKVEWECSPETEMRPLFLNTDAIESVWVIGKKYIDKPYVQESVEKCK